MNTIFIGGSRHVSRLPAEVKKRLDNVIASHHQVIVGDANGADKAVQKHFFDANYANVTVFCSGDAPRNNLGSWTTHRVHVPEGTKGFQFYAAKDREMAREADFGLMIWDGKSPGTVLNVLRWFRPARFPSSSMCRTRRRSTSRRSSNIAISSASAIRLSAPTFGIGRHRRNGR